MTVLPRSRIARDRAPSGAPAVGRRSRERLHARLTRSALAMCALALAGGALFTPFLPAPGASATSVQVLGSGSSFAGPEVLTWQKQTSIAPYNLDINFTSNSSGTGRFNFAKETSNFAVSDIQYQPTDPAASFPFIYIPVTAGGLAFMYNLPGLSTTLQLSSYSACAIFTGAVAYWDDPIIAADNPGVTLPHIPVTAVTRSDPAGTNYVFQQYCIAEQPALWAAFVAQPQIRGQAGVCVQATVPCSTWPTIGNDPSVSGSTDAANTVAESSDAGYITAVETSYAIQLNFPVASVKNASGDYTQPSPINVDSALAYATQLSDGTQQLHFDGLGPHVYNPSTYSYMLIPTTVGSNFTDAMGAALSAFVNFSLTIGQQPAPAGYGGLGLTLEEYGVDQVAHLVPGAVSLTSDEVSHYASGDLTPAEVAAGQTTPTAPAGGPPATAPTPASAATTGSTTAATGTTSPAASSSSAATSASSASTKKVATTKTTTKATATTSKATATTTKTTATTLAKSATVTTIASASAGSSSTNHSVAATTASQSVSLGSATTVTTVAPTVAASSSTSAAKPLAFTGLDPRPLLVIGLSLLVGAEFLRRLRVRAGRVVRERR
jgi:phosphate transport system substrate-binding protein